MRQLTELVATRVSEQDKRRIQELAAKHYDANESMAARRVLEAGLQVLGLTDRRPEVKTA